MKKKLLIFNSYYYPEIVGGAEISTKLLAEYMKEYTVYVVAASDEPQLSKNEVVNGVNVIRLSKNNYNYLRKSGFSDKLKWHYKNSFNRLQKKEISKIIDKISPDLISTQNLNGIGTYVWGLAKKRNIPTIHTLRDYQLKSPTKSTTINFLVCKLNKFRSKNVDHIIGITHYIADEFINKGFFKNATKKIIPNTVNVEPNEKKQLAEFHIGYFGRLEEEKGINFFLETVIEASKYIDNMFVDVIGTSENANELIEKYKRYDFIKFHGLKDYEKTLSYMSNMHVVIVPSLWPEPFGRVIIEAYSQGTIVLATSVGGIPEVIYEEEYLVSPNDKEELTNKIVKISRMQKDNYYDISDKLVEYSASFKDTNRLYTELFNYLLKSNDDLS